MLSHIQGNLDGFEPGAEEHDQNFRNLTLTVCRSANFVSVTYIVIAICFSFY